MAPRARKRSKTPTSERNPAERADVGSAPAAEDEIADIGERLRQAALLLTMALVVARASWPGEGTDEISSGSGLPWTFALLWTAALGIAGAWLTRALSIRVSWADVTLVALALVYGLSTTQAADRRVAINLAWEWAGVTVAYLLIRNLPRTRGESKAVVAALLCAAVALATYGLVQVGVELPRERQLYRENPVQALRQAGIDAAPGSPEAFQFEQRLLQSTEMISTFALANSLAGYLIGPLVIATALLWLGMAARRGSDASERPPLSALLLFALPWAVLLIALLLTKSRSGYLACAVGVAIVTIALAPRLRRRTFWLGGLGLIGVVIVAAAALWKLGFLDRGVLTQSFLSLRYRFEYWVGAWNVLTDGETWRVGLGPGNFRAAYRQHKLVEASEDIADPHNLFLETWCAAGILGLLFLVGAILFMLRDLMFPGQRATNSGAETMETPDAPTPASIVRATPTDAAAPWWIPWAGLTAWLGVIVFGRLNPFTDDGLTRWLMIGLGWIFAIVCGAPLWRRVEPPRIAFAGAFLAVILNLCAAGGISYAPVALMLWGLAAVGLNLRDDRSCGRLRTFSGLLPPFLISAVLAAVIGSFYGAVAPYWRMRSALEAAERSLPSGSSQFVSLRDEQAQRAAAKLEEAIAADAAAVDPLLALAELELLAWLSRGAPINDPVWARIEDALEHAWERNPKALRVQRARIDAGRQVLLARAEDLPPTKRAEILETIAEASRITATELHPTNARLRAEAAFALAAAGDLRTAIREGRAALELHEAIPHDDKKLDAQTRKRLELALEDWRRPASAAGSEGGDADSEAEADEASN